MSNIIFTTTPAPVTIITSTPPLQTIITQSAQPGTNGTNGRDGIDGINGINGTNGTNGRDYDPAELVALRALIDTVQATVPLKSAANTWTGRQTFGQPIAIDGNAGTNAAALTLNNVGGGTSGIAINRATGGDLQLGAQEAGFWGFYATNRSMMFKSSDRAYDTAPQSFDFQNHNASTRNVMRLRHNFTGSTGDFLVCTDTSLATMARIDSTGKFSGSAINIKHSAQPSPVSDGDLWTTTAGLFGRINGLTQTFPMLAASNTWTAPQVINQGAVTNVPALSLSNLGAGTSGLTMNSASGGSLNIWTDGAKPWNFNATNRGMTFTATNTAYDSSPQAFLFSNQDAITRTVMRLKQVNATATGNYLEVVNSTDTVTAKIDYQGKLTASNIESAAIMSAATLLVNQIQVRTVGGAGLALYAAYNDPTPFVYVTGAQDGSKIGFNTNAKTVAPTTANSWDLGTTAAPWKSVKTSLVNLAPTTAPTTPNDGDIWTTTTGVYARVAGVTYKLGMTAV